MWGARMMTDNEIIKALEDDALSEFDHWVIDLIKRQKAEIEDLETEIDKQYEQAKADLNALLEK